MLAHNSAFHKLGNACALAIETLCEHIARKAKFVNYKKEMYVYVHKFGYVFGYPFLYRAVSRVPGVVPNLQDLKCHLHHMRVT